jgi:hypothetical protein
LRTRVNAFGQLLPKFVGLPPRECKARVRVRAQTQDVASALVRVGESPTVRAAIDEQLQEQAIAVAQAEHIGAALDVPYLQIAFDEVTRHCKNFFGRYADILSSCKSSCNVARTSMDLGGLSRTLLHRNLLIYMYFWTLADV